MNWKMILGVALGLILVYILFTSMAKDPSSNEGRAAATATSSQVSMVGNTPAATGGKVTAATIGTSAAGTTLTGSQCRATCKGKCGRNPLLAVTKRQKASKACHKNCRATTCQWISEKDYGHDE